MTATSSKPKANTSDSNASFIEAISGFARGVKQEWGKISWPTWPQIWAQTIVVLVMASVVSLGLWAVDNLIHWVIQLITPHAIK